MIIAVDFDGTLCENKYPEIGDPNIKAINCLKSRQKIGDKIILWTCRTGDKLQEAIQWCEAQGIIFDRVNENLPEIIEKYGEDCRKITAHEYWDDRAVRVNFADDLEFYDVRQIASWLNVNEETVRRWVRSGKLRARNYSPKRGILVANIDLTNFVKSSNKYRYKLNPAFG